jgi:E3 ubiquitin-protein ligase HUWE1
VIDLITGLDMSSFHSHGGWNKMLDRLQQEVAFCAREVPGILPSQLKPAKKPESSPPQAVGEGEESGQSDSLVLLRYEDVAMDTTANELDTTLKAEEQEVGVAIKAEGSGLEKSGALMCMPERAALIKSVLNFLKKAIPEPTFAENIRTCKALLDSPQPYSHLCLLVSLSLCVCVCLVVDSSLPHSLMHIVSNAEYYGPSIYLPGMLHPEL